MSHPGAPARLEAAVLRRARAREDVAPAAALRWPAPGPEGDRAATAAAVAPAAPSISWWERGFLSVAILDQQDAFLNVARVLRGQDGAVVAAPSDPLNFALVAMTLAGMAVLIPRHRKAVLEVAAANRVIVALCALVMLSAVWSVAPGLSAKRSVVHLNTALLALYMGGRLDLDEALRCVALAAFASAAASLVLAVAVPSIGVMHSFGLFGKWRGVYTHKNELAQAMAIGVIAQAYLTVRGRALWSSSYPTDIPTAAGRITGLGIVALELLLLVRAGSATGLAVAAVSLTAYAVLLVAGRGGLPAKALLAVGPAAVLGVASLLAFFPVILTRVSGKDATLTGRTELWAGVIQAIGDRPWLGYGFQAFWSGADADAIEIWRIIRWNAPNAHNGYLEVLLGLGLAGLMVAIAVVVQALVRAMRLLGRRDTFFAGAIALALTGAITIETFTEAVLVQQSDIDWFMLLLVSFAASRLILAQRQPLALERRILSRARPLRLGPAPVNPW